MTALTNTKNKHVLIIDDDEDDCALIAETLHEIDTETACDILSDSKTVIPYLAEAEELPHIIFLDLHMPKMTGVELLKLIKSDPSFSSIPVIVCTDSKLAWEIEQCKILGAVDVINKPSSFVLIKYEIRKSLKLIADTKILSSKIQA
jgi:CheY-like chemotaxis protein